MIERYSTRHEDAVRSFNARIHAGGSRYKLPVPSPPGLDGFVALDGDVVRGGYFVKHQPFLVAGEAATVQHLELPVSEGSVDPTYSPIGVQILLHAQRQHPLMYSLGVGGVDLPLPRMLATMGWRVRLVPFFFRVVRAAPFLRNIRALRDTRARRLGADLLAASGAGRLLFRALHLLRTTPSLRSRVYGAETVESFGAWADDVWTLARPSLTLAAQRDAAALDRLYPPGSRFVRVRVTRAAATVGWAVLVATDMHGHAHFGDMRVGTLVDCLAVPGHERAVIDAATRELVRHDVALIVTNQLHAAWQTALRRAGYLSGPSNYAFGTSRRLGAALGPDPAAARVHMTRGDGSGPIHL
ncbi:MAG TPA: hypothetical protein VN947_05255 [Polyangia bacterium]|nr:hypothetical protein [Polyangia bacterium]